jgi:hypothetical protein
MPTFLKHTLFPSLGLSDNAGNWRNFWFEEGRLTKRDQYGIWEEKLGLITGRQAGYREEVG